MDDNPLFSSPEREKSGGETFEKYRYQYHWAFCKALDLHTDGKEYAIFIEQHEDVVAADSLNVNRVNFEFNQVKSVTLPYTKSKLLKPKKEKSVLGKLLGSVTGKPYSSSIKSVNFISTGGFSLKKDRKYESIHFCHLDEKHQKDIIEAMEQELGSAEFTRYLSFIVPTLQPKDFENAVKGKIGTLVNNLSGGSHCSVTYIYSAIIEDMYRKGENTFDYGCWDESLRKVTIQLFS